MVIIIDGLDVCDYVSGLQQSYNKIFDNTNSFTDANGTEHKKLKGTQISYSVNLSAVPTELKNKLKARNKKNMVLVTIGESFAGWASLRNFSASCINDRYFNVSFTLTASQINSDGIEQENYKLKIYNNDGETYNEYGTAEDILLSDIVINLNAGGVPCSGVLASQLTFTIDKNNINFLPPNTGAKIEVIGFKCPTYFISSRSYTENTASFTATDRTIYLDLPFDYEAVSDKVIDGKVNTDDVLNVIVLNCGFWGHRTDGVTMDKLLYSDLQNTTCRQILQIISECSCGVFFCDQGNNLVFEVFGGGDYEFTISEDRRTDITEGIVKGPINGIISINEETGQTYRQGTTADAYSCFKINSKYIDEELAVKIYNLVYGKTYREFNIYKCELDRFPHIGSRIYGDAEKSGNCFILSKAEVHISSTGIYGTFGADSVQESEWDFEGNITRELKNKIEQNKKYKGVSISRTDGLKCEGTAGKITMEDGSIYFYGTGTGSERYGFTTQSGGLTKYDGIFTSSKDVQDVTVNTDTNTVTVNYTDGHTYTYSADITKTDKTYNITNEKEAFK